MRKITYFIRNAGHTFRTKRGKNDIFHRYYTNIYHLNTHERSNPPWNRQNRQK